MSTLVLLLGGSATRFGGTIPKQFVSIENEPLFSISCRRILEKIKVSQVVFVVKAEFLESKIFKNAEQNLRKSFCDINFFSCAGGPSRHLSFLQGMKKLKETKEIPEKILVHDANRPFLSESFLERVKNYLEKLTVHSPCFVPVLPISDSICRMQNEKVLAYENRENLFRIQTPQLLYAPIVYEAIDQKSEKRDFSDEGSFLHFLGYPVFTFKGDEKNIKITYREDLKHAFENSSGSGI